MIFVWTAVTGWIATLLFVAGVSIPYLVKARRSGLAFPISFRPHHWLGLLIPAAAFLHATVPMSNGRVSVYNLTGLIVATCALLCMLWQAGLGIALRAASGPDRIRSRRLHFSTMLVIALLVAMHIVLNRA